LVIFTFFIKSQNLERDGGTPFWNDLKIGKLFTNDHSVAPLLKMQNIFFWFSIKFKISRKLSFSLSSSAFSNFSSKENTKTYLDFLTRELKR